MFKLLAAMAAYHVRQYSESPNDVDLANLVLAGVAVAVVVQADA